VSRAVADAVARLAIARAAEIDEFMSQVYVQTLEDLDAGLVRRACGYLARLERGEFESAMPSVGTIRNTCATIAAEDARANAQKLLGAMPKSDRAEPTYYCLDCHDEPSGWRVFTCRGVGEGASTADTKWTPCGRIKPHGAHSFAEKCVCLPYNPVSKAARDRMAVAQVKRTTRAQRKGRHD